MAAQDAQEDIKSTARLLYDITAQMYRFGPYLATKMSYYSSISLPWGLGAAGAETVKQGVDSGNTEGIAKMTAAMVNLGLLGTVHDIVVSLCAQDRADAVAAVTASLLSLGEITIVTRVTNALVASSHSKEAATISGELISQGNTQVYEVVREAGLNMGLLDNSASSGNTGAKMVQNIKEQGAQLLDKLNPQPKKEEGEATERSKTTAEQDSNKK